MAGGIDAVDALAVAFQLTAFETLRPRQLWPHRPLPGDPRPGPLRRESGSSMRYLARYFAQPPPPPGGYGTSGITAWIQDNVVTVVILLAACAVLGAARSGNIGKGITITAGRILGVAVLGLTTGTTATDIGNWLVHLVRSS